MIINLSKSKLSKNKTFNVGVDTNEIKIIDLAKLILVILKKELKILPMQVTQGSPYRRCPSMKKYKRIVITIKQWPYFLFMSLVGIVAPFLLIAYGPTTHAYTYRLF